MNLVERPAYFSVAIIRYFSYLEINTHKMVSRLCTTAQGREFQTFYHRSELLTKKTQRVVRSVSFYFR